MEINDDIKDMWRRNTKKKITYLTIDWICNGNVLVSYLPNYGAETEADFEDSVQECNNNKQSCKNKLIASIFKKNQNGWIVPNSNIVLKKYNSLTSDNKNTIHDYVLRDNFKFPFLSDINMNDVVYIIPLNIYMYLQEFYMHVCNYVESPYAFSYTTINIVGVIIPIRTEQWTFESHFTYPTNYRVIIDTLFEKHRNTIHEDLWRLVFSNINRFYFDQ
jgi:hypothetical protein